MRWKWGKDKHYWNKAAAGKRLTGFLQSLQHFGVHWNIGWKTFFFFLLSNWQKEMLYNPTGTLQALKLSPTSPAPIAAWFSVESFVNVIWQSKLNSIANFQTAVTGQLFTASLVSGRLNVEKKDSVFSQVLSLAMPGQNKAGNLHFSVLLFQAACRLWHTSSHQFKWAFAIGLSIANECLKPTS